MPDPAAASDKVHRLILMRHAKSDWSDEDATDHDRILNDRGRRDAPAMAAWIDENDYVPDLILCSTAIRTRQTAEAMMGCWQSSPRLVLIEKLYLSSPETIFETVRCETFDEDEKGVKIPLTVMVLAHNPGISYAASILAGESVGLPTAALLAFRCQIDSWFTPLTSDNVRRIDQMKPKALPGAIPRYDPESRDD